MQKGALVNSTTDTL